MSDIDRQPLHKTFHVNVEGIEAEQVIDKRTGEIVGWVGKKKPITNRDPGDESTHLIKEEAMGERVDEIFRDLGYGDFNDAEREDH